MSRAPKKSRPMAHAWRRLEAKAPDARPTSAPRILEAGSVERDLFCAHYEACLDVAIAESWEGFSCGSCPIRGTCRVVPEKVMAEVLRNRAHHPSESASGPRDNPASRAAIVKVLAHSRRPQSCAEVAKAMGGGLRSTWEQLQRLVKDGAVQRVGARYQSSRSARAA